MGFRKKTTESEEQHIILWTIRKFGARMCPLETSDIATMNKVSIYKGWCKKCGICVAFCPRGVLALGDDGFPTVKNPDACTACGWCELRCPDFAIMVHKDEQTENA